MNDFDTAVLTWFGFAAAPFVVLALLVCGSCAVAKALGRGRASAFLGLLGPLGWIIAARAGCERPRAAGRVWRGPSGRRRARRHATLRA